MVVYNFKKMRPVHKGYSIKRIRAFYMRKVKYTQQTFNDKISVILEDFPRLDDIHPFYADLSNVLYDRDHYKLALGQLNVARGLIDKVGKDYVRMLKYADSQYRAKSLKVAALGRMATVMKKQGASLDYLEQVRQHMSRLPSIDPAARTLLICGFPNVGKSSFINKVTQANVEVQPYAFTTKSLYVGHMDHRFCRWQVIDTPGILDHPLEARNTIEMQAITALAHLRACVLYFIDPSEECGHTLEQQLSLFENIKPLFASKPLVVVANKMDICPLSSLTPAELTQIQTAIGDTEIKNTSTMTEQGIQELKELACGKLLEFRVASKVRSKKADAIMNKLHVAVPKPRDNKQRPVEIPASVLARKEAMAAAGESAMDEEPRRTERDLMLENGGAGVYNADWRKQYSLKDPSWRNDVIPEIMDGANIADFVDPEIEAKLAELEAEEELLLQQAADNDMQMDGGDDDSDLDEEEEQSVAAIRQYKGHTVARARMNENSNRPVMPRKGRQATRNLEDFQKHLVSMGITSNEAEGDAIVDRMRSRSRSRSRAGGKRGRSESPGAAGGRDRSRSRTPARTDQAFSGAKAKQMKASAEKIMMKKRRMRNKMGKAGEADRVINDLKPKHMLSGKTSGQKTRDRR